MSIILTSPHQQMNSNFMDNQVHKDEDEIHKKNILNQSTIYKKKPKKDQLIAPELQNIIHKIQVFVDNVDSKIQNRVQLVKQVYLNQYKQQVLSMSLELKNLRDKLDTQLMRQRANQKMFYLQEQRDFFRAQVLKLNDGINKINQQNRVLKKQIDDQKTESQNYKKIAYNLQSKLLKIKNLNYQREKAISDIGALQNLQTDSSGQKKLNVKQDESQTKFTSGAQTQRLFNLKSTKQKGQQSNQKQNNTQYRLRGSKSMKSYSNTKYSSGQKDILLKSNTILNYPKKTTQKLEKIEGYSDFLQKQQIIDECINEVKKEIYYRNLNIGQKQTKFHFNQAQQTQFNKFTKTDKKQLIVKLISNQKILNQFYQFLFFKNSNTQINANRQKSSMSETQRILNNKLDDNNLSSYKFKMTDQRFNTQMLTNLKTQFNRKIFDIKNNR